MTFYERRYKNMKYYNTLLEEQETLINIAKLVIEKNLGECLVELDRVLASGKSPLVFSNDLIAYFRDLLLIWSLGEKSREIVVVKDDVYESMKDQARDENYSKIVSAIEQLSEVEQELRYSAKPRIVLETALIKTINQNNLIERVENLEKIVKNNFPS